MQTESYQLRLVVATGWDFACRLAAEAKRLGWEVPPVSKSAEEYGLLDRDWLEMADRVAAIVTQIDTELRVDSRVEAAEQSIVEAKQRRAWLTANEDQWLKRDTEMQSVASRFEQGKRELQFEREYVDTMKRPALFGRSAFDQRKQAALAELEAKEQSIDCLSRQLAKERQRVLSDRLQGLSELPELDRRLEALAEEKLRIQREGEKRREALAEMLFASGATLVLRLGAALANVDAAIDAHDPESGGLADGWRLKREIEILAGAGAFRWLGEKRLAPAILACLERNPEETVLPLFDVLCKVGQLRAETGDDWSEEISVGEKEKRWLEVAVFGPVVALIWRDDFFRSVDRSRVLFNIMFLLLLHVEDAGFRGGIRGALSVLRMGEMWATATGDREFLQSCQDRFSQLFAAWKALNNARGDESLSRHVLLHASDSAERGRLGEEPMHRSASLSAAKFLESMIDRMR